MGSLGFTESSLSVHGVLGMFLGMLVVLFKLWDRKKQRQT